MNYIGCDSPISSLECVVVNEQGHESKKQRMNKGVKELKNTSSGSWRSVFLTLSSKDIFNHFYYFFSIR